MNRRWRLLFCIALVLPLAACGQDSTSTYTYDPYANDPEARLIDLAKANLNNRCGFTEDELIGIGPITKENVNIQDQTFAPRALVPGNQKVEFSQHPKYLACSMGDLVPPMNYTIRYAETRPPISLEEPITCDETLEETLVTYGDWHGCSEASTDSDNIYWQVYLQSTSGEIEVITRTPLDMPVPRERVERLAQSLADRFDEPWY